MKAMVASVGLPQARWPSRMGSPCSSSSVGKGDQRLRQWLAGSMAAAPGEQRGHRTLRALRAEEAAERVTFAWEAASLPIAFWSPGVGEVQAVTG